MSTFTISNDSADFGTFDGETPAHALAAMHRDAGYASKVVDGVVVPPASAVDADGVSLCPGIDDVTIAEGAGAAAERLGVDVATLRRWRAPGGWLHTARETQE